MKPPLTPPPDLTPSKYRRWGAKYDYTKAMVEEERTLLRILVDTRELPYWTLVGRIETNCPPRWPTTNQTRRVKLLDLIARLHHCGVLRTRLSGTKRLISLC